MVRAASHTGRLLQSLCFTSLSFLLLHIIYQITVHSLLASNSISTSFNSSRVGGLASSPRLQSSTPALELLRGDEKHQLLL
uniref:Piezo TM1-24 domain-containing protein n=1 Tax=Knipowitschia caucasica TaxID=637954 RepID=A0AAV2KA93_KNICA